MLTLFPVSSKRGTLHLNPIDDIRHLLSGSPQPESTLVQLGGNIVLFMPLGFFLPLTVPSLNRLARMTVVGAALSISIETTQYFLPAGRYASTLDVILNTLGTACGFLLMEQVAHRVPWFQMGKQ